MTGMKTSIAVLAVSAALSGPVLAQGVSVDSQTRTNARGAVTAPGAAGGAGVGAGAGPHQHASRRPRGEGRRQGPDRHDRNARGRRWRRPGRGGSRRQGGSGRQAHAAISRTCSGTRKPRRLLRNRFKAMLGPLRGSSACRPAQDRPGGKFLSDRQPGSGRLLRLLGRHHLDEAREQIVAVLRAG
jgi:hypothetical protein